MKAKELETLKTVADSERFSLNTKTEIVASKLKKMNQTIQKYLNS